MAVQLIVPDPAGTSTQYHRVIGVQLGGEGKESIVRVLVGSYLTEDARQAGAVPLRTRAHLGMVGAPPEGLMHLPDVSAFLGVDALSAEGMNPIRGAYLWIKTLPEYAGAVDV